MRPIGRARSKKQPVTASGLWKREQRDRRRSELLRWIVIGAGCGRCGSTCLAANLQAQQWDVSHEAGNSGSIDKRKGFHDRFTAHEKDDAYKKDQAQVMLRTLRENLRAQRVVGDISWANTPFAKALLDGDLRVRVVFQTRPPAEWVKSHLRHHPKVSLWENHLLSAYGIRAAQVPDRRDRLRLWSGMVQKTAGQLKKEYQHRVSIVPLKKLDSWGPQFLQELRGTVPWDGQLGRNASGESRDELRLRQRLKRRTHQRT